MLKRDQIKLVGQIASARAFELGGNRGVVGVVDLVHAGSARNRSAAIVAGIIVIVLGLILVLKPDVSVKVVAILWGIGFLLGGLIRIVVAIADRGYGWGWRLLLGLLGLGLGLAIADRLVEAMGGELELRDTPGGGLTVVVSLPVGAA